MCAGVQINSLPTNTSRHASRAYLFRVRLRVQVCLRSQVSDTCAPRRATRPRVASRTVSREAQSPQSTEPRCASRSAPPRSAPPWSPPPASDRSGVTSSAAGWETWPPKPGCRPRRRRCPAGPTASESPVRPSDPRFFPRPERTDTTLPQKHGEKQTNMNSPLVCVGVPVICDQRIGAELVLKA